jgi:hypothetical protein
MDSALSKSIRSLACLGIHLDAPFLVRQSHTDNEFKVISRYTIRIFEASYSQERAGSMVTYSRIIIV